MEFKDRFLLVQQLGVVLLCVKFKSTVRRVKTNSCPLVREPKTVFFWTERHFVLNVYWELVMCSLDCDSRRRYIYMYTYVNNKFEI